MALVRKGHEQSAPLYCEVDGAAVELRPQDLSLAGLFIPGSTSLVLDRELDLLLRSPIGELTLRAQVVQVISRERAKAEGRTAGSGLLFIHLEDHQRAFIGLSLDAVLRTSRTRAPRPASAPLRAPAAKSPAKSDTKQEPAVDARPNPEAERLLRKLEQELLAVQSKSPWVILGIAPDADAEAARQAFLTMSKRYHPHAYARFDCPQISKVATEIFIAHKKAHAAFLAMMRPTVVELPPLAPPKISLGTPASARSSAKHVATAKPISQPPPPRAKPANAASGSTPPPPRSSQPPKKLSSQPPPAAQSLVGARRAADAERAVALGLKHLAASRFDDAAVELERARALHPGAREPELWLRVCHARDAKAHGRAEEALNLYREVLELDPEHREALDYSNAQTPRKRAGLFQKWLGRGDD
jgi:tetratricopeptide (TPR) repeat protein